jgi:uncharacterized membrane protein YsdA (DUF1294 family)
MSVSESEKAQLVQNERRMTIMCEAHNTLCFRKISKGVIKVMNIVILVILAFFLVLNLFAFMLMGIDKRKAIKQAWRIPESTLFAVALIGGSLGAWIGMYTFRHKTQHKVFVIGIPIIFAVHMLLAIIFIFFTPYTIRFM